MKIRISHDTVIETEYDGDYKPLFQNIKSFFSVTSEQRHKADQYKKRVLKRTRNDPGIGVQFLHDKKIVKVPIKLWVVTVVYDNDGEISFTSKTFPEKEKKEAWAYLKELYDAELKEGMFHCDTDDDLCDGCLEENINQNGYNLWDNRNRAMYGTITEQQI